MKTFLSKQIVFIFIPIIFLLFTGCMLFKKKDPTSVEQAEKLISKDRQKRKNQSLKAQKNAREAHWGRQSKEARKTIKRSGKERKRIEKIKKQNVKRRKKRFG
jgi:hypothetical protein